MNYLLRYSILNKNSGTLQSSIITGKHGIKSLSTILIKHLTNLGQKWTQYLPLATFVYNTFNTPNLANYSPYELDFGRKPKLLLNLETTPDIKVLGTLKDYCNMLNKRLLYLHKLLQEFRSKRLVMIKIGISFNITAKI